MPLESEDDFNKESILSSRLSNENSEKSIIDISDSSSGDNCTGLNWSLSAKDKTLKTVKIRAESPSDTKTITRVEKSCISSTNIRRNVEQYVQRNQTAIIHGVQKGASNVQVNRTTDFHVPEDNSMIKATTICEEEEEVWVEGCSAFSKASPLELTKNLKANSISCCEDVCRRRKCCN